MMRTTTEPMESVKPAVTQKPSTQSEKNQSQQSNTTRSSALTPPAQKAQEQPKNGTAMKPTESIENKKKEESSIETSKKKKSDTETALTPNSTDVICGQGLASVNHVGNCRFRLLLEMTVPAFVKSKEPTSVARSVVQSLMQSKPPGRFLYLNKGKWTELPEEEAINRTLRSLKEVTRSTQVVAKQQAMKASTITARADSNVSPDRAMSSQESDVSMTVTESDSGSDDSTKVSASLKDQTACGEKQAACTGGCSNVTDQSDDVQIMGCCDMDTADGKRKAEYTSEIESKNNKRLKLSVEGLQINNNDVLCGPIPVKSIGNRRFQVMVELHKVKYSKASSQEEREAVALAVIDSISHCCPAGRIYEACAESQSYVEVPRARAIELTEIFLNAPQSSISSMNFGTDKTDPLQTEAPVTEPPPSPKKLPGRKLSSVLKALHSVGSAAGIAWELRVKKFDRRRITPSDAVAIQQSVFASLMGEAMAEDSDESDNEERFLFRGYTNAHSLLPLFNPPTQTAAQAQNVHEAPEPAAPMMPPEFKKTDAALKALIKGPKPTEEDEEEKFSPDNPAMLPPDSRRESVASISPTGEEFKPPLPNDLAKLQQQAKSLLLRKGNTFHSDHIWNSNSMMKRISQVQQPPAELFSTKPKEQEQENPEMLFHRRNAPRQSIIRNKNGPTAATNLERKRVRRISFLPTDSATPRASAHESARASASMMSLDSVRKAAEYVAQQSKERRVSTMDDPAHQLQLLMQLAPGVDANIATSSAGSSSSNNNNSKRRDSYEKSVRRVSTYTDEQRASPEAEAVGGMMMMTSTDEKKSEPSTTESPERAAAEAMLAVATKD